MIWSEICFCSARNGLSGAAGWRAAATSAASFCTPFINGLLSANIV